MCVRDCWLEQGSRGCMCMCERLLVTIITRRVDRVKVPTAVGAPSVVLGEELHQHGTLLPKSHLVHQLLCGTAESNTPKPHPLHQPTTERTVSPNMLVGAVQKSVHLCLRMRAWFGSWKGGQARPWPAFQEPNQAYMETAAHSLKGVTGVLLLVEVHLDAGMCCWCVPPRRQTLATQ